MTEQKPRKPHPLHRPSAVIFLLVGMVAHAAGAEDAIKPGNWEYTVTGPSVAHVEPDEKLPPGARIGPDGRSIVMTKCITAAGPLPSPPKAGEPCKIDKSEVNGGTVSWSVTCVTAKITAQQEQIEHYHGKTMDGQMTVRGTVPDHPPFERTMQLTGRYLGPCAAK
jgi:hypothetical protein